MWCIVQKKEQQQSDVYVPVGDGLQHRAAFEFNKQHLPPLHTHTETKTRPPVYTLSATNSNRTCVQGLATHRPRQARKRPLTSPAMPTGGGPHMSPEPNSVIQAKGSRSSYLRNTTASWISATTGHTATCFLQQQHLRKCPPPACIQATR
jgi:hypothetical protein